jgi:hypothetical protein
MNPFSRRILLCFVALIVAGCAERIPTRSDSTITPAIPTSPTSIADCPVTPPNGNTPPGEQASPDFFGNGMLWTGLWQNGTVLIAPRNIQDDGALATKFFWWRGVHGALTIEGKRLDAPAPPLRSRIPEGYGDIGFQSSAIIFPTEGCWQVTGKVGASSLTFVTRVVKVDKLPWE